MQKFSFFLKMMLLFLCLCLGIAGYLGYNAWNFVNSPANANAQAFPVDIPKGSSLEKISLVLEEKGIVSSAFKFELYARAQKNAQNIQAGTFLLSPAWTPKKILGELTTGSGILYRLTIREGLPWWEVAKLLEQQGFCKATDFKEAIFDKAFLQKKGIPFANAEGYLYPDTYLLHKPKETGKDSAYKIANRLIDTFYEKTKSLKNNEKYQKILGSPKELNRLLTLASIVEKETRLEEERPVVAGVYYNRLKLNMILQADPTVIYGLGQNFNGQLLKKHLQDKNNPYNTYQHMGLPPTPICSPSLSAIKASLKPAEHGYLYFVAKGIGASHVFSTNLRDHNNAVREYKKNLQKK